MRIKKLILIPCLVLFAAIAVTVVISQSSAFATDDNSYTKNSGLESGDALVEKLNSMSIYALIDEVNELSHKYENQNAIIYHAIVLSERIDELNQGEISAMIMDSGLTTATRCMLVQICGANDDIDKELFSNLLMDENTESEIKQEVIAVAQYENISDILLTIAQTTRDDQLAFQAIKRIGIHDVKLAISLSDSILKDKSLLNSDKYKIALLMKSKYYTLNPPTSTDDQFKQYLELCTDILDENPDATLVDTIGLSLAYIPSKEIVKEVLSRTEFDNIIKAGCIHENYEILLEVAKSKPSLEDIELLVDAVQIHPILNLVDALYEAVSLQKTTLGTYDSVTSLSSEPADDIMNTLNMIKESGNGYYIQ